MKKSYRVVGEAPFKGHRPGEVFEAEFADAEEARYVTRGAIELADGAAAVKAGGASGEGGSGDGGSSDTGRGAGASPPGGGKQGKE